MAYSELLAKTYFNKIFEKNEKDNVQELMLLQKGKRSFQ